MKINKKAKQVINYKPSDEFVNAFNILADGYSHTFRYEPEKDKIFFSALTHKCGVIQIYADSTEEMETTFIEEVMRILKN